jgi:predicted nucleic acid-binding protein
MIIVTATTASRFVVVDSSGWLEYLTEDTKADLFAPFLKSPASLLLPTIVVYEVYKTLLARKGSALAEDFAAHASGFREHLIPLDAGLSFLAARLSLAKGLHMADAIIYATAQAHGARLITSDTHFDINLPGVTLV